jgi:hypothetical protein
MRRRPKNEADRAVDGLRRYALRLTALLVHPDLEVRTQASSELLHLGGFGVVCMIQALYQADDPELRVAQVRLLGRTGAAGAVLVRAVLLRVAMATDERDVAFHQAFGEAFDRLGAHLEDRSGR